MKTLNALTFVARSALNMMHLTVDPLRFFFYNPNLDMPSNWFNEERTLLAWKFRRGREHLQVYK
jgi:hypothetical protein